MYRPTKKICQFQNGLLLCLFIDRLLRNIRAFGMSGAQVKT